MRHSATVLLGYEIGTGAAVEIPIVHTIVAGQTQQSGKTTTLEALVERSGRKAVTFVTKRAEGAFREARRIPAFFREQADWQSVQTLLEASFNEKMKFERSWIMRVCKGARTLRDVQKNVEQAHKDAVRGIDESIFLVLQEYLAKVVPEVEQLPTSEKLELRPGINAIDVSSYSTQVQGLVIRSVMDWIYQHENNVIVIVPEAWKFIPQKRNSPVKLAAIKLIRETGAAGNAVWLDSQDLAGVDTEIRKQCTVWILGVQREVNEVKRILAHLPAGKTKIKPDEIMQLGCGEFWVAYGHERRCVYVQPLWLSAAKAKKYAMEELPESYVAPPDDWQRPKRASDKTRVEEETVPQRSRFGFDSLNAAEAATILNSEFPTELRPGETTFDCIVRLLRELKARRVPSFEDIPPAPAGPIAADYNAIVAEVLRRLKEQPEIASLQVSAERPEITVKVQRKVIELDDSTLRGRLAVLIAEGWFDDPRSGTAANKELARRGSSHDERTVYRTLDEIAVMGFLTKEPRQGYRAVAGMKVNIQEAA